MINAGKYNRKIQIYRIERTKDTDGFPIETKVLVGNFSAEVKTTSGMTLIANDTDFEKALTRFVIRTPLTALNRHDVVMFKGKEYSIEYINNYNESDVETELQCRLVVK